MPTAAVVDNMLTGSETAILDANAAALGVSRLQLMEAGGAALARAVRDRVDDQETDTVTIVAGRGNNGGDAVVAARHLEALDPTVVFVGRPDTITTDIARQNWDSLQQTGVETRVVRDATAIALDDDSPDLVVDGLVGTGVSGALREPVRTAAAAINRTDATVVSVDVPSGLDAETGALANGAVRPDHVVSFHVAKPGLEALEATVTVANIGLPAAASRVVGPGDLARLDRSPESHKGENGTVLIVGGGPYAGAPALTGQAALRSGADLVWVATPATAAPALQGYSADLIVRSLEGERLGPAHGDQLGSLAADVDTVVIGPGLGEADQTRRAVRQFLERATGTVVVDADALTALADGTPPTEATVIATPHRGELAAMGGPTGEALTPTSLEQFAATRGAVVLAKGPTDMVSDDEQTRLNRTGHPGMTVGGTGDVLAGVTGAFAARIDPFQAAGLAAFVTGRAGERAAETRGTGLVASDLLETLPGVVSER